MSEHEIFASPFVRLASASVYFDGDLSAAQHSAVLTMVEAAGFEVTLGHDQADTQAEHRIVFSGHRDADELSVAIDGISLMTAQYDRWAKFRNRVADLVSVVAVGRKAVDVKLSILNEIRPPDRVSADGWAEFVRLPVPTPDLGLDHVAGAYGGLLLCEADHGRHVSVQWAHSEQAALDHDHVLAGYYEPSEEAAVLAVDWLATADLDIPAEESEVMNLLDELHASIKDSFLLTLTDRAVEMMREST